MSTIKYLTIILPSLLLTLACGTEEPSQSKSELLALDAAAESNDKVGDESDAGATPSSYAAPATTTSSATTHTNAADAGVPNNPSTDESGATGTLAAESESSAPSPSSTAESTSEGLTSDVNAVQWRVCGPGQCGTIEVPMDYDDPKSETLSLTFFVGPATEERRGVVYFNPGGPGMPVVSPDNSEWMYAELNQLMPSMDIVLMDNRGIGESEPIDCIAQDELIARAEAHPVTNDLEYFEALGDYWRGLNEACVSKLGETALSNFHTTNVARDMDRVREALGEDKINLWMVSYGTVQASAYAALFPEHVGSFVLDSPAYLGQLTVVDDIVEMVLAYEHELTRFLEWCAVEEACGLGSSNQEVKDAYESLRAELDNGVVAQGMELSADNLDGLTEGMLMYGEWDALAALLRELVAGNWDALLPEPGGSEPADPDAAWQIDQANAIYRLLDYGCPASYSAQAALELGTKALEQAPHFALKASFHLAQCVGWFTHPSQQRVITKELPSAPLLIITSAHDAATPLEGARAMQAEFNNASLLYVSNKEGHGVLMSDAPACTASSDFIQTGQMSSFCEQLPCEEAGAVDLDLNSLRVSTKPQAGKQRLPRLPDAPSIRFPR